MSKSELVETPQDTTIIQTTGPVHPGALINMAMSRTDVDIDKLEQLFELQKAYEENEAKKDFNLSMAEFRALCPVIEKTETASFPHKNGPGKTEYKFASLGKVLDVIKKPEEVCGLSHSWKVDQLDGGQIKVTCFITHKHGHSEKTALQNSRDDTGSKNNLQSMGSTIEYLKRYTLFLLLGLSSQDTDGYLGDEPEVSDAVKSNFSESENNEDIFNKIFPSVEEKIKSGKKTADQIITFLTVNKKMALTADQINQLKGVK